MTKKKKKTVAKLVRFDARLHERAGEAECMVETRTAGFDPPEREYTVGDARALRALQTLLVGLVDGLSGKPRARGSGR